MNNKPLNRKSYGSIAHLSNSKLNQQADKKIETGQELMLTKKVRDWKDLIIIQEKVDGSNICFAKIDNKIVALTKAGYEAKTSPYQFHHKIDDWLSDNYFQFHYLLNNDERICGEWMTKVHSLKYNLPHGPFIAFDIIDKNNKRILYLDFIKRTNSVNITTAGLVHIGQPLDVMRAMKKMSKGYHGCLETPEGLVYRVEREGRVDFLAKYVRPGKIDGLYIKDEIENEYIR